MRCTRFQDVTFACEYTKTTASTNEQPLSLVCHYLLVNEALFVNAEKMVKSDALVTNYESPNVTFNPATPGVSNFCS